MKITVPELALVVLVGPSGSGKSTFARTHFRATEVLSSDTCRGLVSDDPNDQDATADAFAVLNFIAAKRLAAGRLTVVDATNVQAEARRPLIALAREYHCLPVVIALALPERLCLERNQARPDRGFGPHVVKRQAQQMRQSMRGLKREGFRHVTVLSSPEAVAAATIERQRLWTDRRDACGPFDIIGDVHGCCAELESLLAELGYDPVTGHHPAGRRIVFLGDLVDRGPDVVGVLRLAMRLCRDNAALCVAGNHEHKLLRKLRGHDVKVTHGLAESLAQLEREPPDFRAEVMTFLDRLISHYVLDGGKLVVAHAGMKASMQGRGSARVREFALYGETTGETDAFGLPVRYDWAADYRGRAMVVYGHTPVPTPEWLNNTLNVDTGCVFGGRLTALRYPEKELVSVPAQRTYAEPMRPLGGGTATTAATTATTATATSTTAPAASTTATAASTTATSTATALTAQQAHDDLLDLADVVGSRRVTTRLHGAVMVREGQSAAALEVMSRFAVSPKWLIYLPPTMSPPEAAPPGGPLEHPAQAFAYFRAQGVAQVVCEEKHMGSRAVIVLCRDAEAARRRFGVQDGEAGICVTRTGRRFFAAPATGREVLDRVRRAVTQAGLWEELETDWLCLDCELMPWSAKALELVRGQYAAVGAAARAALPRAAQAVAQAAARGVDVDALLAATRERAELAERYTAAYRRYCWSVASVDDLRLAPFHLLASEGRVHADRGHAWHMQVLARLAATGDPLLVATATRQVDLADAAAEGAAIDWWQGLTAAGGEGMVVKPADFVARGPQGLVQPALKCRGAEYLRLIYGMEYTRAAHLDGLRGRRVQAKRSLARREFALGIEALERFVRHEPLRSVHACVFGVLALESEPIDPRL